MIRVYLHAYQSTLEKPAEAPYSSRQDTVDATQLASYFQRGETIHWIKDNLEKGLTIHAYLA